MDGIWGGNNIPHPISLILPIFSILPILSLLPVARCSSSFPSLSVLLTGLRTQDWGLRTEDWQRNILWQTFWYTQMIVSIQPVKLYSNFSLRLLFKIKRIYGKLNEIFCFECVAFTRSLFYPTNQQQKKTTSNSL